MNYIENLRKAGVPADIDIYPGLYHAFDMLTPFRRVSKIAGAKCNECFRYAQEHYFAENEEADL